MRHISKAPCKGCQKRSIDPPCHDRCPEYLAYKADAIKIREKREEQKKQDEMHLQQVFRRAKMRGKVSYGKSTKRSGLS